jgi:hypothetical protein
MKDRPYIWGVMKPRIHVVASFSNANAWKLAI